MTLTAARPTKGAAMSTTIVKTHEELLQWRRDLLERVRIDEVALYERGEAFQLMPEDRNVYETLRAIDYLLGDD
jgi:hypothetical protein